MEYYCGIDRNTLSRCRRNAIALEYEFLGMVVRTGAGREVALAGRGIHTPDLVFDRNRSAVRAIVPKSRLQWPSDRIAYRPVLPPIRAFIKCRATMEYWALA